jgi:hypothetical protein
MLMKEHLFDKRVVQRALQEGLIDQAAYQRMLDALPDLSHKLQSAPSVLDVDDIDDDEEDDDELDDEDESEEDEPKNAPTYSPEL